MGKQRTLNKRLQVPRILKAYADASLTTVVEMLWPTRCCICEAPGELVCGACRLELAYIDQWLACPRCGAPFGMVQCTECNELSLASAQRQEPPFSACVSALHFDDGAARIVRVYKDAGERGLVGFMGYSIACSLPPEWITPNACVVPVPATAKAKARRGFDHGCELASKVAEFLDLPCAGLLEPGKAIDQRALGRSQRMLNAAGHFKALHSCEGLDAILVDDVYTTGATAFAATDALVEAGAHSVRCATFARVY